MAKNGILISTKDKFDYPIYKSLAWILIPGWLVQIAIVLFVSFEYAVVGMCVWGLFLIDQIADVTFMKKSYVELHEQYIKGVSMGRLMKKGVAFTVAYREITDVYAADDILTVRTAHGKYRIQAYKCEKEVKEMILNRMPQTKRQYKG